MAEWSSAFLGQVHFQESVSMEGCPLLINKGPEVDFLQTPTAPIWGTDFSRIYSFACQIIHCNIDVT